MDKKCTSALQFLHNASCTLQVTGVGQRPSHSAHIKQAPFCRLESRSIFSTACSSKMCTPSTCNNYHATMRQGVDAPGERQINLALISLQHAQYAVREGQASLRGSQSGTCHPRADWLETPAPQMRACGSAVRHLEESYQSRASRCPGPAVPSAGPPRSWTLQAMQECIKCQIPRLYTVVCTPAALCEPVLG